MKGFLYTDIEIEHHADWLLFGPCLDAVKALGIEYPRVLDVGCGTGALGKMLEIRGVSCSYTGVDLSWDNIVTGKKAYNLCSLFQGNVYQLPFRSDAFDIAISVGVMQSLPDVPKALEEIFRVGSSRAVIEVVEAPVGINSFLESGVDGLGSMIALYNRDQLLDLLKDRGLPAPDLIFSRSSQTDYALAKPFYRNIPYRVRSLYFWGV